MLFNPIQFLMASLIKWLFKAFLNFQWYTSVSQQNYDYLFKAKRSFLAIKMKGYSSKAIDMIDSTCFLQILELNSKDGKK